MKNFCILSLLLLAVSCGGPGSGPGPGPGPASPESAAVQWPELSKLHDLQIEAHEFLHESRVDEARTVVTRLVGDIPRLAAAEIPKSVKNRDQVKVLLQDLGSLGGNPDFDPAKLDDKQLDDFVHVLHVNIAKLMDTAGLPHVHDH